MFAVTGPVLDHARLAVDGFPVVVTTQPERVAVARHHAFGVAETTHRIAVAIDDFGELAVVVVAILDQRFDALVGDHALIVKRSADNQTIGTGHLQQYPNLICLR